MNKEQKVAKQIIQTASDRLETAHRALTNALAFLERSPIQGMKSIELLQEAFAFIYELRAQVEKDIAKAAETNSSEAKVETTESADKVEVVA